MESDKSNKMTKPTKIRVLLSFSWAVSALAASFWFSASLDVGTYIPLNVCGSRNVRPNWISDG